MVVVHPDIGRVHRAGLSVCFGHGDRRDTAVSFVHLHTHTEYSILDGVSKVTENAQRAAELGQPALAITDHGSLSGAFKHYQACRAAGIKPIIGSELYVAPVSRDVKARATWGELTEDGTPRAVPGAYTHLTVLADGPTGLRNLYRLQHLAYGEGFYYKPRVDREILAEHAEGLIVLSGCLGSEVATWCRLKDEAKALETMDFYRQVFPGRYYAEVMDHGTPEDSLYTSTLASYAVELSVPVVVTNDSHYTLAEHSSRHSAMLCVQSRSTLENPKFTFNGSGYWLKSRRDLELQGIWYSSWLNRTLEIADSVGDYSPVFEGQNRMPKGDLQTLTTRARNGLIQRLHGIDRPEYWDRLNYELGIIDGLGYTGYILCIADLVGWAHARQILVGPGRGSAPASLVAFSLGITSVDPIEHGLVFERFLNPSRVSAPDFDIDIPADRREEVLAYARETYGEECVAQIQTFGVLKSRYAIKDAARVLGRPARVGQELANLVPEPIRGKPVPLSEAPDARRQDPEVYDLALGLEGTIRQASRHAAGVVISGEPLSEIVPVTRGPSDKTWTAGLENSELEALGLVKYDILGLNNLTVIKDTLEKI